MINQATLGFVTSQSEHIEADVMTRKYPDVTYAQDIPVDTSAHEWSTSVGFFSRDDLGAAALINGRADDVPLANLAMNKHTVPVHMAAIGYSFSVEEVGQAQMMGMNLTADGADSARRSYERFVDDLAYIGKDGVGNGEGLYTRSDITTATAAASWSGATADAILSDVNTLLAGVLTGTNGIEMANVVKLPLAVVAELASKRLSNEASISILEYLKNNNIYTATTGQPLDIKGDHRLDSLEKVVVYRKDPTVLKLHVPMPLRFLAPQVENLQIKVPGMFRVTGLEVRTPGAIRQMTGI